MIGISILQSLDQYIFLPVCRSIYDSFKWVVCPFYENKRNSSLSMYGYLRLILLLFFILSLIFY